MQEYSAAVGATDGNIIAAIITTQIARNHENAPSPVHGPSSIPRIWSADHHQLIAARATSRRTKPRRARTATSAGPSPPPLGRRACTGALTVSGGPGELGRREAGLALVLDAEGVDARPLRLGHGEVRSGGMEHPVEPHRLTGFDSERDDVLDFELDRVSDKDGVAQAVVVDVDCGSFDPEHLAHQGSKSAHRPAELPAEDLHELVELLVGGVAVDEDAEPPVPVRHDLRGVRDQRHLQTADVGALNLTLTDVEDEGHATEVVGRTVIEGQVARAHQLAGARLDVTSRQVPSHRPYLLGAAWSVPPDEELVNRSRVAADAPDDRPFERALALSKGLYFMAPNRSLHACSQRRHASAHTRQCA